MKKWMLVGLMCVAGCSFFQKASSPGPEQSVLVQTIQQAAAIGCRALPPADQQMAVLTIRQLKGTLPPQLANAFMNPAQSPALFAVGWSVVNGILNSLPPAQYQTLLPIAEQAVVDGCGTALGA